jgi:hypothetical protein
LEGEEFIADIFSCRKDPRDLSQRAAEREEGSGNWIDARCLHILNAFFRA